MLYCDIGGTYMSREEYLERQRNELVGQTIGNIEVLRYVESRRTASGHTRVIYECKCLLCGNVFETRKDAITSGHTKSCGCVRENWMHSGECNRKHGLSEDRAYWLWTKVKARCYRKTCREYKNYGGRGIKMCEEWLDPKNFVEWCYSHGYDKDAPKGECTIDRIDVDGDYCPENCRFITNLEQQNNKRNSLKFEYKGETHTIAEWARIYNIPYMTMAQILKSGKSLDYINDGYTPRKRR